MSVKIRPIALVVLLVLFIAACGQSNDASSKKQPTMSNHVEPNATIVSLYNQSCIACHSTGSMGAPRSHDVAAWQARLKKGSDILLAHTKLGLGAMPAMGMCGHCTDADFEKLITYMASPK